MNYCIGLALDVLAELIATPRRAQTTLRNNNHRTRAQVYVHAAHGYAHTHTHTRSLMRGRFLQTKVHRQIVLTHVFPLRRHVNAHTDGVIPFRRGAFVNRKHKRISASPRISIGPNNHRRVKHLETTFHEFTTLYAL